MAFVEKGQASIDSLKSTFLPGREYETKTRGTQHQPPAMPVAEGVYSLTYSGSSSYLTYILTIPEKLERKQLDLGLEGHGSFIISVKNPEKPGPKSARLPEGPKYPKE
jgi:uroporphyrinogen-III synthase